MVELRYIKPHQPTGMIVDVEEKKVDELLKSGEYELVNDKKEKKEVKKDDSTE